MNLEAYELTTHEDLSRAEELHGPSDRLFGLVVGTFFLAVSVWPLRKHLPPRWWAMAVGVLCLGIALARPALLRSVNREWTRVAALMNRLLTAIVTGMLFYFVFTPAGFVYRLFKNDPLRCKVREGSYWLIRDPPGPPAATMANQF